VRAFAGHRWRMNAPFLHLQKRHVNPRATTRRMIMKTIASALIALAVVTGIATEVSAQSYGWSAPSGYLNQNQDNRDQ
jgi:hypothetical protein